MRVLSRICASRLPESGLPVPVRRHFFHPPQLSGKRPVPLPPENAAERPQPQRLPEPLQGGFGGAARLFGIGGQEQVQGAAVLFHAVFPHRVVRNQGAADKVGIQGVRLSVCGARVENIVAASLYGGDAGERAAAGAGRAVRHQHVVQPVADNGLAFAVEVGDDGGETAAAFVYPVFLYIDHVFVQMQAAVAAGVRQKTFRALVDLVDGAAETPSDKCPDLRFQHFGHGNGLFGADGHVGTQRKLLQHLGGRNQNARFLRVKAGDVFVQPAHQVVKLKTYQRVSDGGVKIAVGAQEKGNAVAGKIGARQHAPQHIARPQGGFFGGHEENPPAAARAGRESHRDFPARGRPQNGAEIAALLRFECHRQGFLPADSVGVDVFKMLHEDAFVDNGIVVQTGAVRIKTAVVAGQQAVQAPLPVRVQLGFVREVAGTEEGLEDLQFGWGHGAVSFWACGGFDFIGTAFSGCLKTGAEQRCYSNTNCPNPGYLHTAICPRPCCCASAVIAFRMAAFVWPMPNFSMCRFPIIGR